MKVQPYSMKAVFTATATVLGERVVDRFSDSLPTTRAYRNRMKSLKMTNGFPFRQVR